MSAQNGRTNPRAGPDSNLSSPPIRGVMDVRTVRVAPLHGIRQ